MDWFAKKVNSLVENVLFVLLVSMTIIVFLQVLFRYVLNVPLYWTEEAARFLMIWIVFIGASVGIRRGSHLGFTWIVDKSKAATKRIFAIVANIGLLGFSLNVIYYGSIITLQNTKQLSAGLQIPMSMVYSCLPVCGILNLIQLAPIFVKLFHKNKAVSAK